MRTSVPHPKDVKPTTDYWVKEGHMWKRVHVQPRMDLYIPQQADDGPDVTKLTQHRTSIVRPTNGTRGNAIEDDWTTKRRATLEFEWTGSTNFEEQTHYKDEFITEDIDEQQEAKKAKGLPTPPQPTEQERMEHELTHLPYRSWCPVCVRSKGRADNHPKQHSKAPVIQVDITYYKAMGETKVTPILTAVDVETGMCMAVQGQNSTYAIPFNMPTPIPHGMRQNTSNTQQHGDTVRPRRLLDGTTQDDSSSSWKHSSQTITSIHLTGARQCRAIPQNTDGTNQSTQVTT